MSHVVAVDVEAKDKDALIAAGDRCGLIDVETQNWDWYGRWVNDYDRDDAAYKQGISVDEYGKCLFALVQKDSPIGRAEIAARAEGRRLTHEEVMKIRAETSHSPYSVGVVANPSGDGSFKMVYDFFSGGYGLRDKIGEGACKIKQQYGVTALLNVARKKGHTLIYEIEQSNGDIRVRVQVTEKVKFSL